MKRFHQTDYIYKISTTVLPIEVTGLIYISSSSSFYVNLSTLKCGLDVINNNFLLHKDLSCASFSFNPHSFMSFVTHSIHVFLLLPFFFTPPTTSNFLHLDVYPIIS